MPLSLLRFPAAILTLLAVLSALLGWSYYKGKIHEQTQIERNTLREIRNRTRATDRTRVELERKESEIERALYTRPTDDRLYECLLSNDPFATECL